MTMLQRLTGFFIKQPADPATAALYSACVAQARREEFYRLYGVADTIDGRFDLLVLHVFLVMRRLGGEGEIKQKLFDLMFADMDQSLREMGVGDMSIGKRMRPMIAAFYGRTQAYEKALAQSGVALSEALARNLYGGVVQPDALKAMTDYVRRASSALDTRSLEELRGNRVAFPGFDP